MSADGMVEVFMQDGKLQPFYPRVLVFDKEGAYVFGTQGYGGQTAANIIKATNLPPQKNVPRLEAFAAFLRDADGKPIAPAALKGRATVAQLGASWCKPCHQLEAELRRVGGINLLLVDADTNGRIEELKAAMRNILGR
jgi:hypothetical protein